MKTTTTQTDKYLIELDFNTPPIVEIALREFMSKVLALSDKSKCMGHNLSIKKVQSQRDKIVWLTNRKSTDRLSLTPEDLKNRTFIIGRPKVSYSSLEKLEELGYVGLYEVLRK